MADKPIRMRAIVLLVGGIFLLAGCGSGPNQINEAPPLPPTATPAPRANLDGELLAPLTSGEEVAPSDHRYTLDVPGDWTRLDAPEGELSFEASGGLVYAVTCEPVPDGIVGVQDWAEQVQSEANDVETESFDPVQIGGVQAARWIYRTSVDGEELLIHTIFLTDGPTGFILTGTAPADDADASLALFDSVAGSFTFPRG